VNGTHIRKHFALYRYTAVSYRTCVIAIHKSRIMLLCAETVDSQMQWSSWTRDVDTWFQLRNGFSR